MRKHRKVLLLLESSHYYGRGLLRGIFRYSTLNGPWRFEWQRPFYLNNTPVDVRITKLLTEVDGVIMRQRADNAAFLTSGVPVIFASHLNEFIPDACQVISNDDAIGACAADHFLLRGLSHFAYLGFRSMLWSEQRKTGFSQALERKGYRCHTVVPSQDRSDLEWSQEQHAVADWIRALPKPIGLFTCNDDRAKQAADACFLAGVDVPHDVAIVGVDDDELVCNSTLPPLSSVALNLEAAGYQAAELLDQMMQGQAAAPREITVEPTHVTARQSSEIFAISDPAVLEAIRFIHDNARRPLQVEDVLEHVSISRRGLYNKFKRVLGYSIHAYIKKVRIEQIETLLLETDWSIAKIAHTMGFSSPDHIATYFRSVAGLNPCRFRHNKRSR